MKYLIIALVLTFSTVNASEVLNDYYNTYSKKDIKAKYRAAQHPKGSGIGTNKYNVRYDRDYSVDKYKRVKD